MSDTVQSTLDELDAIVKIAGANFPANTDLRVEIHRPGRVAGSLVIASYTLAEVIELARAGLSRSEQSK